MADFEMPPIVGAEKIAIDYLQGVVTDEEQGTLTRIRAATILLAHRHDNVHATTPSPAQ